MKNFPGKFLGLLCALCLAVSGLNAQTAKPAPAPAAKPAVAALTAPVVAPKKLRVVTRLVEPFVMEKGGKLSGYSIELWDQVAAKAGLQFDYEVVKTVPEMLTALREGKADVAVAALTINAEREKTIDFSYPFYQSGLKIAVSGGGSSDYLSVLAAFFSKDFLFVLGMVLGLLIVATFLVWILERKGNNESFPDFTESFWYSLNVIIAGGCENKSPNSLGGRIVATIWMLVSLILVSSFTATITSTLTVNNLSSDIKGMSDLPGRAVGTLEGTSAAAELKEVGVEPKYYPDLRSALKALQKKELDAVVYDAPILMYLVKEMNGKVQLLPALFNRQAYGFGMKDSTGNLRKTVNLALLSMTEEGVLDSLDKKWFGEDE